MSKSIHNVLVKKLQKIKWMGVKEFREEGYLQEANRQFFHPLGLALEIIVLPDGTELWGVG